MSPGEQTKRPETPAGGPLVAVIDVGTSSIRLTLAQVAADGRVGILESLQQGVCIGRDVFATGVIHKQTMEKCVQVLHSFGNMLEQYQVTDPRQIHAIATSAVREADNRDEFLDRLLIATGIRVQAIDEYEVSRYTYLRVQPFIESQPAFREGETLVIEVGGGSTETLILRDGFVRHATMHRLGTIRMRQTLEESHAPATHHRAMMEAQIENALSRIRDSLQTGQPPQAIALGHDIVFAATQLAGGEAPDGLARIAVGALEKLANRILKMSVDEVVRAWHLSYPEAETLGPGLLTHVHLARGLGYRQIHVAQPSFRDGVLSELVAHRAQGDDFSQQILRSARQIGEKYRYPRAYAEHVALLAERLFTALQGEHRLPRRYAVVLNTAALLHEIGLFISNRRHHKHSYYLIQNSDLFGLSTRDVHIAALVARYHRRALPSPLHPEYMLVDEEARIIVKKLAALLRVAVALDKSRAQRIRNFDVELQESHLAIHVHNVTDLTLERVAMQESAELFELVYGKDVVLRVQSAPV